MNAKAARPILKWAGGKRKLLPEISARYPEELSRGEMSFVEPFVGGGTVMLDVLSRFELRSALIADANLSLTNLYLQVRDRLDDLADVLRVMSDHYLGLDNDDPGHPRKEEFYLRRAEYNSIVLGQSDEGDVRRAALFIFLNRTCFNGLYRVNPRGEFNVPSGTYKNPLILDYENLATVSSLLQNVDIVCESFASSIGRANDNTFVYLDPPYRPLTKTSSFTSYSAAGFNDSDQEELARSIRELDRKGAKFLLSNSDPKHADPNDEYFDDLYEGFTIERIETSRSISAKSEGRTRVTELLIRNY